MGREGKQKRRRKRFKQLGLDGGLKGPRSKRVQGYKLNGERHRRDQKGKGVPEAASPAQGRKSDGVRADEGGIRRRRERARDIQGRKRKRKEGRK